MKAANMSKGYTSSTMGPIKSMAPEALRYHQYSEASDVFSFGCVLWEIAVGEPPWKVRGWGVLRTECLPLAIVRQRGWCGP